MPPRENPLRNPISLYIWEDKYKGPSDKTVHDTFNRVAKALASVEKPELQQE
jgi:hypothetical protein